MLCSAQLSQAERKLDEPRDPGGVKPGRLGPIRGLVVGWLGVIVVNAVFITLRVSHRDLGNRVVHHWLDAGQLFVLAGLTAAWAALLVLCLRAPRWATWLAWAASAALLAGLFSTIFDRDLSGFVARRLEAGDAIPYHGLFVSAAVVLLLGGGTVAARLAKHSLARVGVGLLGAVLSVINNLILPSEYPAAHLSLAIAAAIWLGAAAAHLTIPMRQRRLADAAAFGALLLSLPSWFIRPNEVVWRKLFELPGAVVAPFAARYTVSLRGSAQAASSWSKGEWFARRSSTPPRPPSSPRFSRDNPVVLLVTVDALREDLVGRARYEKQLLNLHRMKRAGAYFSHARAPSPSTATTFASLDTGRYYSGLYWTRLEDARGRGTRLFIQKDDSPRLATLLSEAGVQTTTVQTIDMLGPTRGWAPALPRS